MICMRVWCGAFTCARGCAPQMKVLSWLPANGMAKLPEVKEVVSRLRGEGNPDRTSAQIGEHPCAIVC